MKRFRRPAFYLSMMLMCIVLLPSCGLFGPNPDMMHATASHSVPGMFEFELMGTPIQVIEQDEYKRVLFSYTAKDGVTGQKRTVWVICQKMTSKEIYYYEDFNYSFSDDQEAIESLKQKNDWGKPLDEQKFSVRRPIFYVYSTVMGIPHGADLNPTMIDRAIMKKYRFDNADGGFCDADGHGNELWLYDGTKGEVVQEFFVIVNSDYDVEILEIVDDTFSPEDVHQFKIDSGWVFG